MDSSYNATPIPMYTHTFEYPEGNDYSFFSSVQSGTNIPENTPFLPEELMTSDISSPDASPSISVDFMDQMSNFATNEIPFPEFTPAEFAIIPCDQSWIDMDQVIDVPPMNTYEELNGNECAPTSASIEDPSVSMNEIKDEESATTGRKRKRQKKDKFDGDDGKKVDIPRDVLLRLRSEELEGYARELVGGREFTPAEWKLLKKQKRLIKNRESAQASRQRKKSSMEEMEGQIKQLQQENDALSSQVHGLREENLSLRRQLEDLTAAFNGTKNNISSAFKQLSAMASIGNPKKKAAAGLSLMIMLFAFGIFFNGVQVPAPLQRSSVSIVAPSTAHFTSRTLLSVEDRQPAQSCTPPAILSGHKSQVEPSESPQEDPQPQPSPKKVPMVIQENEREQPQAPADRRFIRGNTRALDDATLQFDAPKVSNDKKNVHTHDDHYYPNNRFNNGPDGEARTILMTEFMNESNPANLTESDNHHDSQLKVNNPPPSWVKIRPNTAYFTVSDLKRVPVPSEGEFTEQYSPDSPLMISLLVPASSLSHRTNLLGGGGETGELLMEITTQLVDIKFAPQGASLSI